MTERTIEMRVNPTNAEIVEAIDFVLAGGSLQEEDDTGLWSLAVVRYVNDLGPDPTNRFGVMAYERVTAAAQAEGCPLR